MRPLNFKSIHNAEVFYCIRQEDRKGEPFSSYAWQTSCDQLTSDHARRCVQRLLKNDTLKTALDPLLDIPALRQGLMISTIHKLIEAKVPEVRVYRYLSPIQPNSSVIGSKSIFRSYILHVDQNSWQCQGRTKIGP